METNELINKRIKLIKMEDSHAVEPGTTGTITHIDGIGQLHVKSDNGRTLAVIPEIDTYEIIEETLCTKYKNFINLKKN
jgi:hypothetical protein